MINRCSRQHDVLGCAEVALRLREMLAGAGLRALAKTSGSKGLQVYVPLNSAATYAQTKPAARTIAEVLEAQWPERVVSRMAKALRGGKVLIDWGQNTEHKSMVCAYSGLQRRFLGSDDRPVSQPPAAFDYPIGGLTPQRIDALGREQAPALVENAQRRMRATVAAGLGASLEAGPVERHLAADPGATSDTAANEQALEPLPFRRAIIVRAGTPELAMVLTETKPARGWAGTLHASAGGLELFVSMRGSDPVETRLDWRYTLGRGGALEQFLAVQIMLQALLGQVVAITQAADEHQLISATLDRPTDVDELIEDLEARRQFLGYVTEVEAWLGRILKPPPRPSARDATTVSALLPLIRQPKSPITWTRVSMAPGAAPPDGEGPFQFSLLQPLYATLFGEELYVGMEWLYLPEGRVIAEAEELAIVPYGATGTGTSTIFPPDEVPAEAARTSRSGMSGERQETLSVSETAQRLGYTREHVLDLVRIGALASQGPEAGSSAQIPRSSVVAFEQSRERAREHADAHSRGLDEAGAPLE